MYFIAAGIFKIVARLGGKCSRPRMASLGRFYNACLGPLLLSNWAVQGFKMTRFRVLGIFIGIDLFFRGLAVTVFALDLRKY